LAQWAYNYGFGILVIQLIEAVHSKNAHYKNCRREFYYKSYDFDVHAETAVLKKCALQYNHPDTVIFLPI